MYVQQDYRGANVEYACGILNCLLYTSDAADDDKVGKEMDGVVVVLVAAHEWILF